MSSSAVGPSAIPFVPPPPRRCPRASPPSPSPPSVAISPAPFWHFSSPQWLFLFVLFLADLFTSVSFSCIVPFFPTEAKKKGLSTAQVGLIIGIFQLTMFCTSPFLGKTVSRVGSTRMLVFGLSLCSVGSMLYGFLKFLVTPTSFLVVSLLMRCLTAFGSAAFRAASMTKVAQMFPDCVSSVMGIHLTVMSIGYIIGPTIGSALYELGGFSLPFFVLGSFMLFSALMSALFAAFWTINWAESDNFERENGIGMEKANLDDRNTKNNHLTERSHLLEGKGPTAADGPRVGLGTVLRVPELQLMLLTVFMLEQSLFFYDSSLTDHIAPLSAHASFFAGLLLSLGALVSMISGPILGVLLDRFPRWLSPLVTIGSFFGLFFPFLMGPSPLLRPIFSFSVPNVAIAFALQGLAISAINTPSFKFCIDGAKRIGLIVSATNTDTCGCISGLLNAAVSLGAFIGVTLGGVSIQWVGFEWTATFAGLAHLLPLIAQMCFFVWKKKEA